MWSVWPDDATHDRLIGSWYFYQRRGGHRTSTDDILAAWLAVRLWEGDAPLRYIDIGCGIGSVLLMTAHQLRPTHSIGIEAQAQSATMALRSVQELPKDAPDIQILHQDLREVQLPPADLITGSPPYFPIGTGVPSPDPQRFACRFETRGGVEAYCESAARLLAPHGLFTLVFIAREAERVQAAAERSGLVECARSLWKTREDHHEPFLSVHALCHPTSQYAQRDAFDFGGAVRAKNGEYTESYQEVRRLMGLQE